MITGAGAVSVAEARVAGVGHISGVTLKQVS
jgi:hypothetical protein